MNKQEINKLRKTVSDQRELELTKDTVNSEKVRQLTKYLLALNLKIDILNYNN